jgi:hypothetical protein
MTKWTISFVSPTIWRAHCQIRKLHKRYQTATKVIHSEDGNCKVFQNGGKLSTLGGPSHGSWSYTLSSSCDSGRESPLRSNGRSRKEAGTVKTSIPNSQQYKTVKTVQPEVEELVLMQFCALCTALLSHLTDGIIFISSLRPLLSV